MVIKAYSKINIVLNVYPRRDDGFHDLDMVMLPLELHDSLQITKYKNTPDNHVTFVDYSYTRGFVSNLSVIALEKLIEYKNIPERFKILINKNIPVSAGLGGGSSDAAATLVGIKNFLKLDITDKELEEIAFSIGADVPFFIKSVPARCRGAGEILEPIEVKNDYYVLLVKPKKGVSTRQAYEEADKIKVDIFNVDKVVEALKNGDDETLKNEIGNSLEKASINILPEIQTYKDKIKALGIDMVLMSGSGSTIFAISTNKKLLKKAYRVFDKTDEVYLTKVKKN